MVLWTKGGIIMQPQSFGTDDNAEKMIRRFAKMIYRLAYAKTGSRQDADDVFQEVFLRYFRKRPAWESDDHAKAWFLRVTVNCANSLLSSPFRRRSVPLEGELAGAPPQPEADADLARAVSRLPCAYREVIHLFYYEDYSCAQIAAVLHRREATVRMQLTRARRLLQQTLEADA